MLLGQSAVAHVVAIQKVNRAGRVGDNNGFGSHLQVAKDRSNNLSARNHRQLAFWVG